MKNLQNNYTTSEQSKRLLKLGVPADSADCYYDSWKQIQWRQLADLHNDFFDVYKHYIPCWSVGRLMEIITVSFKHGVDLTFKSYPKGMIESLISSIVELEEDLNFSKLEE